MANYKIAVLKGDGIGPEIVSQSLRVLDKIGEKYNHTFTYTDGLIGGVSIDKYGIPLTDETVEMCLKNDAVILGAVGGPKWDSLPGDIRPEKGLLKIRKSLGVYANLRISKAYPSMVEASPLKKELIENFDCLIVRELTGGIYFGEQFYEGDTAYSVMKYTAEEVRRIAHVAFKAAMSRRKKVTNVDKSNVLAVSRLWREIVNEVAKEYPEVTLNHLYVDIAAMKLVTNPSDFDVVVTGNLFGDILSDEAAVMTGSIGLLPSASVGDGVGLYEPIHGSAPDIAGLGIANPIATILSVAMMLRHSFNLEAEASNIEEAIEKILVEGYGTKDLVKSGPKSLNTVELTDAILKKI